MKFRSNLKRAFLFRVFYINLAIINRRLNVNRQLVCAVLDNNAALDALIRIGALHSNGFKLIARSLQVHSFGTGNCNLLRLDTRPVRNLLFYATAHRSYRHILAGCQNCVHLLTHIIARIEDCASFSSNLAKLIDSARLRCQFHILAGCQSTYIYICSGIQGCAAFSINFATRMADIAVLRSYRHILTGCHICRAYVFHGSHGYLSPGVNFAVMLDSFAILATVACRCQRYILSCL